MSTEEKLLVYSEDGTPLYLKERSLVHKDGDLHQSVQCWICDKNQNTILQLRHPKKSGSPNKLDVSVGGHCAYGESAENGVLREAKEELGIDLDEKHLKLLSKHRYSSQEGRNQELIYIYIYEMDFDIDLLDYQKDEIEKLKCISIKDLKKMYDQKDDSLANRQGAFESLFQYYNIVN